MPAAAAGRSGPFLPRNAMRTSCLTEGPRASRHPDACRIQSETATGSPSLDQGQRPQLPFQMPLQVRGHQPAGLAAVRRRRGRRRAPSHRRAGRPSDPAPLRRRGRPGRPAVHAHAATRGDVEGPVRAGGRAAGAFGQRRRPAGDPHGPQQIGVEHQFAGRVPSATARNAPMVSRCRRAPGHVPHPRAASAVSGDGAGAGVAAVVVDDVGGERVDGHHLGDDVEVAARVQLDVDVGERLSRDPNLLRVRRTPLATARTRPCSRVSSVTMRSALAELVLANHHRPVPIQPHPASLASAGHRRGRAPGPIAAKPGEGHTHEDCARTGRGADVAGRVLSTAPTAAANNDRLQREHRGRHPQRDDDVRLRRRLQDRTHGQGQPLLRLAAEWRANDVLNNRALDGDIGSNGSTVADRRAPPAMPVRLPRPLQDQPGAGPSMASTS